jgi:outer membrane lipoprotein-sorting protein
MTQKLRSEVYILMAFVLCFVGCAIKSKPEPMPPPDARSVLLTLKTRYDLVETMRTLVNFKVVSRGKGSEVRGYLNYAKPDKLSVYAMGPFNEPRVIAIAAGESLKIYFVVENELIDDQLKDEVMKDLLDIDLRISDIRSAIFANPLLEGNTKDLKLQTFGDEYVITRPSIREGCTEEISVLAKNTAVSKWRIKDADGKLVQEISFSKYREIGGILRSLKAVVYRPEDDTTITIESVDPELNVKLADDVFELSVPEGVEIYKFKKKDEPIPE